MSFSWICRSSFHFILAHHNHGKKFGLHGGADERSPRLVPESRRGTCRSLWIGGQGQLWGEHMATPEHRMYMTYPRAAALVLDACDREGAVRIRRRNGRSYTLRTESGPDRITALPDFRTRTMKIFPRPIPAAQGRLGSSARCAQLLDLLTERPAGPGPARPGLHPLLLQTLDADLMVGLFERHARPLVEMLRGEFYANLSSEEPLEVYLASAEDTVLAKLDWYRQGGEVSDRQWRDVLGVLKVQGDALDRAYLREWAGRLALTELLRRACDDAGLPSDRAG